MNPKASANSSKDYIRYQATEYTYSLYNSIELNFYFNQLKLISYNRVITFHQMSEINKKYKRVQPYFQTHQIVYQNPPKIQSFVTKLYRALYFLQHKMNKTMGDFRHHCDPEDNVCWQQEFSHIIGCRSNDIDCWRKKLPELPCQLQDIKCWKNQMPDLPCEATDFECLKNKLPDLPCQILDMVCWQRYVKNWDEKGQRKTVQGTVPNAEKRPLNWIYQSDAGSSSNE